MKPSCNNAIRKLAVAGILGSGALAVWMFVSGLAVSIAVQRRQPEISESLGVTKKGEVIVSQYHRDGNFNTYRTLDGQPFTNSQEAEGNYGAWLYPGASIHKPLTLSWQERIVGFSNSDAPPNLWYLVHDGKPAGHAYFVGYNSASKQFTGYIGLNGFRMELPPPAEQFPIPGNSFGYNGALAGYFQPARQPFYFRVPYGWLAYVCSDGKLYLVDLNRRSVEAIAIPGEVVAVTSGSEPTAPDSNDSRRVVIVRTRGKLTILNSDNKLVSSFTIPEPLQRSAIRFFNWWTPSPILASGSWPRTEPQLVFWLDAKGNIAKQRDIDLLVTPEESLPAIAWATSIVVPSPLPAACEMFAALPLERVSAGKSPDYLSALNDVIVAAWPAFLMNCLLSVILAVWCYRRHRRYSEKGAAMWAVFVLLFGAPAIIGYLLQCRWPVTERCQKCAAESLRDRDTCLSCGADFPLPVLKGIEVFA